MMHRNRWREGATANFEYHCYQGHDSCDAELWYRSQQVVTVLCVDNEGFGGTPRRRIENGEPRTYRIRFADGYENTAHEDELYTSVKHYTDGGKPGVRP